MSARIAVNRSCDGTESRGIVFAHPDRIKTLRLRGHLTLMDATHETNWLGWLLYAIMVRDEHGCWVPGGHFLTEKEDGDIIAEALKVFKQWCGGRRGWRLRYMLTDDSAAEISAVRQAFKPFMDADIIVDHLLCMAHSERTLKRNFAGKKYAKVLHHMITALKFRSSIYKCRDSMREAIKILERMKDYKKLDYLMKEWWDTSDTWASYARRHSTILMQIKDTNPVEGWHSTIKYKTTKSSMQQFSLKGVVQHVLTVAKEYDLRARKAAMDFRTRRDPMVTEEPWLADFPYPVQQLIT